jgi:RND family efflux transporter MFP subunit
MIALAGRLGVGIASAGLLWLASLGGCSRAAAGPVAARAPQPVQLHTVATAELPQVLVATGVLAAQEELVLGLEVSGRLARVPVDVGDRVPAGAELAVLEPRDLELAVQRAAATVVAAEARLALPAGGDVATFDIEATPAVTEAKAVLADAERQRERIAAMVQQSAQSGADLDTATANATIAASRLQRARDDMRTALADVVLRRVELLQAQQRLAQARLVAPFAGRVAARHAIAGQVLLAGAPVVTLLRVDPLRLQLRVPDRAAVAVAPGQRVEFTVDGSESVARSGRVVRQGPAIDRGDRTRLVEAEVDNADGALLPGAFCRAHIVTAPALPVVVVPRTAVVSFAGVDRVFSVESKGGGTVAKGRIVELGRRLPPRARGLDAQGPADEELVEIVRGLAAGDRIVRHAAGLSPATPVQVAE